MENPETHFKLIIDNCVSDDFDDIKNHISKNISTVLFAIEQSEFYKFNITSKKSFIVCMSYDTDGSGYDTLRVKENNLNTETVFIKKPIIHNEITDSIISTRLKNCLVSAGFTSFSQIKNLRNLYRIRNFGDSCMMELVDYMKNGINNVPAKKDIRFSGSDHRTISEEELRSKYEGKPATAPRLWYKRRGLEEPEWSKECNRMRTRSLQKEKNLEKIQEKGFTNLD